MFSDVLKLDAPIRLYELVNQKDKLTKQLNNSLEEYNMSASNKMELVFFEDAVLHIMRIMRALR
jgi:dynein heavy chain